MEQTLLDSVLRWQVLCIVLLAVTCLVLVGANLVLTWLLWKRRTFTEFQYRLQPAVTTTSGSTVSYSMTPVPMPGLPEAAVGWHVTETETKPLPKPKGGKTRKRDWEKIAEDAGVANQEAPATGEAVGSEAKAWLCPKCQVQMPVDHLETNGGESQAVYQCPKCGRQDRGPLA